MSTGFFSIGLGGLAAAQLNLLATEHNIVNANTEGYSRQRVLQSANVGVMAGTGAIGQGVSAVSTERLYDRFVTAQLNTAQTQASSLDAYYGQISQIDNMLADASAGLSPALQDFFAGAQQVAANPSLMPARQSMISSAQTMVSRLQSMDTRLVELNDQVNDRITNAVTEVNAYAAQVADLNKGIRNAESAYGQPANDLRDQRDQLIFEINQRIKVTTTTNSDGTYNLFVGSGQQLVVGTSVVELTARGAKADPSKIVIGLSVPGGGSQELPDALIVGGELGGLVAFRNEALQPAVNEIGRVAASLALTFNAQHALGQDLLGGITGDTGFVGDFFNIPPPKLISHGDNPNYPGDGEMSVDFALPKEPGVDPVNSSNFYTELTNSDYQIEFGDSGNYSITRLTDNVTVKTGTGTGEVEFDGIKLTINTSGANGDKVVIKPFEEFSGSVSINSRIAADPRLVAAGAPVSVKPNISNAGSMTVSQGLVSVGYQAPSLQGPSIGLNFSSGAITITGMPPNTEWMVTWSGGTDALTGKPLPPTIDNGTFDGIVDPNVFFENAGTQTISNITIAGISFDIAGNPAEGDFFTIQRNAGGVQDSRNAVLLAKLQTQNTVGGSTGPDIDSALNPIPHAPTATFQASYARLVADNGVRTREAKVQQEARTSILAQSQSNRDSLSAVNLDEEAANMLKFQQAYQASSKILAIGSKLFESILEIG